MSDAVPFIDPATLVAQLCDGDELAVLDAREQGVYSTGHLFWAVSLPLSQLEMRLSSVVPRRSTRVVWCDGGRGHLAARAARRATDLGWTDCSVLAGGTAAWSEAGHEIYSGVNVPSKAFGELVEQAEATPHLEADDLAARLARGDDVVVLDSRPMGEFRRRSIPSGVDCPGAELVHRVKELAPDPATLVVVNCAGRTRSIIGAQSLINAGLENPVVALANGTMGWELAGHEVARGVEIHAPDPGPRSRTWARAAAAEVGRRFGVDEISPETLARWQADPERTTYLLDVRTDSEFEAGHLPGSVHAPGGQLVQATDEYVATLGSRLVLVDDDGARATMTASWLRQLGWGDAVVLAGGVEAGAGGKPLTKGKRARDDLARVSAPVMRPPELAQRLAAEHDGLAVIDVGTSVKFRNRGHIPGSWWAVRSRLDEARALIGEADTVVLTSTDGTLAKLAVADAARHWPEAEVFALAAGNKGWRHAGLDMESGFDRATTTADDVWYKPYDRAPSGMASSEVGPGTVADHMEAYLTWEVGLVDQVTSDPLVVFPFGLGQ